MRALLLVHQGSRSTAMLVKFLRAKGYEPFVLSSWAFDGGAAWRAACAELGVEHDYVDSRTLPVDEVVRRARELPDCRFCLTVWDGQRVAMAAANEALGAVDAPPDALLLALDKHLMRRRLGELGLSRIDSFRLEDPKLRRRLDAGERHIVKPRRGSGSLCIRSVTSWDEAAEQREIYRRGPGEDDLFGEYYFDNELIAETFFVGRELSFEMIRQGGRTTLACDHERTVLDYAGQTVLERGFASPPIRLDADQVRGALEHIDRCLSALRLDDGCFHIEVSAAGTEGPVDRYEIIEINPRPGGQFMVDSTRVQLGRALGDEWVDTLVGTPVADAPPRSCGTYYQAHYRKPGRQAIGIVRHPGMPTPDMFTDVLKPGSVARPDREELGAQSLWKTDLATHREQSLALMPQDYASFQYTKGLSGRPLFLVFEPINHLFQVIEAADRAGYDVVVFHTLPPVTTGPYAKAWDSVALLHTLPSWVDTEACLAEILRVCGDTPVAGAYTAIELILGLEARVQEHYGLPTRGSALVGELLNKVNVRRRLVEAGLSGLRFYEEPEVDALRSWPVGERALYFKPVHGAGSAFVRRCGDPEAVRTAIADWKAADKSTIPILGSYLESEGGAFFLEEEAPGELLSVEGYVHNGRFVSLGLASRTQLARDPAIEMGATFPYQHPRQEEIEARVARFHEVFGLRHGATHTEVTVLADGEIELVELNLRFIGADCLTLMNLSYGVTFEDDLVALATGGPLPDRPMRRQGFSTLSNVLAPPGLTRLEALELPEDVELPFVKIIKAPGSDLASTDRQLDYIAAFITGGATHADALALALKVRRGIRVNGESIADDPNNVIVGR